MTSWYVGGIYTEVRSKHFNCITLNSANLDQLVIQVKAMLALRLRQPWRLAQNAFLVERGEDLLEMRLGGMLVSRRLVFVPVTNCQSSGHDTAAVGLRFNHHDIGIVGVVAVNLLGGDVAERVVLLFVHVFAHLPQEFLQLMAGFGISRRRFK